MLRIRSRRGQAAVALLGGVWLLVAPVPAGSQEPAGAAREAEKSAAPKMPPMDTWYAQTLAHSPIGINVTHFWSKASMLRAETVIGGRRIVTIVNGPTYYAYDLLVRTGIAVQRLKVAVEQDKERSRPFGNEYFALLRQGAEQIGTDQLGGRDVDVYQITDERGRRKLWVTQDELRLPLRIFAFDRARSRDFNTDFLNWQRHIPILDAFFQPEPGIEIVLLTYGEYVDRQKQRIPIGPVPILYADLLHGY